MTLDALRAFAVSRSLFPPLPLKRAILKLGFVSSRVHALMHPRVKRRAAATLRTRVDKVVAFVRERGEVHPRELDAHFLHGTVTNYWGGSSSATTHLMEDLHYRGWLRVVRRERGIRIYACREGSAEYDGPSARERVDALVDVAVNIYAPLPAPSLAYVVNRLRYATPQWRGLLKEALAECGTPSGTVGCSHHRREQPCRSDTSSSFSSLWPSS